MIRLHSGQLRPGGWHHWAELSKQVSVLPGRAYEVRGDDVRPFRVSLLQRLPRWPDVSEVMTGHDRGRFSDCAG